MSEATYGQVFGFIQQFKDKPAVEYKDVNGSEVREFTIKSLTTGKLVRVSVWPEIEDVFLDKGVLVAVEGKTRVDEGKNGNTYYGITAYNLVATRPAGRSDRTSEVVNRPAVQDPVF